MGEVYRADDLTLGQPVALKFLPEALSENEEFRARFLDELRLAREVSHSSVCRVFDVGDVEGQIFLSMEYIDGEDLSSLLRRVGRLPAEKALDIARQLCAGLAAVHERGIIHRDLKPANVMLDGRGVVRLTDFGLAGAYSGVEDGEEAPAHEVLGTPAYMAPELTQGKSASVASDVYALGLVLYEVFTGHPAFTAETLQDYLKAHREEAPRPPSSHVADLDPAVEEVLQRCLEKDPARRPASALAVSGALPGGDPLAEALARGETPSPEAVAAAGGAGALRPAVAYGGLALAVVTFIAICWMAPRTRFSGVIPLDIHPEVFEQRARDMLDGPLEYTQMYDDWDWDEAYVVSGFDWGDKFERWNEALLRTKGETRPPAEDIPPPYWFWMRASRNPIVSPNPNEFVSLSNPPLGPNWEAIVVLRPDGELDYFLAYRGNSVVHEEGRDFEDDVWTPPITPDPSSVDGDELLRLAGFDPEAMHPIRPYYWPRVPGHLQLAWEGPAPGEALDEDTRPKVDTQAGFHGGRPSSFAIIWPEPPKEALTAPRSRLEEILSTLRNYTMRTLVMVMIVSGVVLMLRNFRQRSGDRRGAARLAWFSVLLMTVSWILETSYVGNLFWEFWIFTQVFGFALFMGGTSWVLYLGLEPYIRRVCPDMLIGWTRILSGRWRDPMVSRDVLVGITAGLLITVIEPIAILIVSAFDAPPPLPFYSSVGPLEGFTNSLADLLSRLSYSIRMALVGTLMFALLRTALRSRFAAMAVIIIIVTFGVPPGGTLGAPLPDIVLGFLKACLFTFAVLRFGVLAMVLTLIVHVTTVQWPLTHELSAWHATPTILLALILGPLAVYAARSVCRGPSGDGVMRARAG
jgi:serine/threonine-protein kinase